MRDHYLVSVTRVPGVTRARMQEYILEAVVMWGGQIEATKQWPLELKTRKRPPCPLMEKNAVTVKMIPRGATPFALKQ